MSSDALEYFYGITPERLDAMRNTPPPKSTDEAWKEHYRLREQYIEELEAEFVAALKDAVWLATEKAKLENYVMRLEEWGDYMRSHSNNEWWCENWDKAKEAKP